MKKTTLTVLALIITTNGQIFSADYYKVNGTEHAHKRTPSQIQLPMIPLEQFVTSLPAKNVAFKELNERHNMQVLLKKVSAEDLFAYAQKTTEARRKSMHYIAELRKTEEIYHFLAAAKIELKLEAPNINELTTKYKFTVSMLIENAATYGITDFRRHFPQTPPPTAASSATITQGLIGPNS
ncbi:hypothetical protein [Candidatus Finniella inopinata]|uniref:Uncharacterized protein n=1 Tax=Candidatus Finniella inopinata TaxID=1696036 RepID=A0A4Q7DJR8_9PROT|nr:hypothetical protein [Candidatus Finniella inopinata]RZI46405.1 hypothetical protein EQU50_02095 [Candidatus Finniella inopinata]